MIFLILSGMMYMPDMPETTQPTAARHLNSWKEIATYLEINVRTAQKWERERSMPVKRLPGARGPVSANAAELDVWRNSVRQAEQTTVPSPAPRKPKMWVWAALIVAFAGMSFGVIFLSHRPEPAHFRVEQNSLVILDSNDHELWRKNFPAPLAAMPYSGPLMRRIWFGDIDGDGRVDVLFAVVPESDLETAFNSSLICYSDDGREKWRFVPGVSGASTRDKVYAPPYRVAGFEVLPAYNRQPARVILTAIHHLSYPTQVTLLSNSGKVLREYWHSGQLMKLAVGDLDHDGEPEIYLGGVSNGEKCATVVVLDPRDFGGASTESNPKYQLLGFSSGRERARLLFPRTCMNRRTDEYNVVHRLWLAQDQLNLEVNERLHADLTPIEYQLRPDLSVISVEPSDQFRVIHREMELNQQLDHQLSESEIAALRTVQRLK
jgi:hypothetical protein